MANNKDFKVKNGIQPTVYHEAVGTVVSGSEGYSLANLTSLQEFSTTAQIAQPMGLAFKPDGTEMYVVDLTPDDVSQYTLSTAWDLSTATYTGAFSVAGQDTNALGVSFKSDGTKMFVSGYAGDDINEYSLSTAWDISTASYTTVYNPSEPPANVFGHTWKPDGTKFYLTSTASPYQMFEYSCSTAWDISTASYSGNSFTFSVTTPRLMQFSLDGLYLFVEGGTTLYKYPLTTAYDLSTVGSAVETITVPWGSAYAIQFIDSGQTMFVSSASLDKIIKYSTVLNTATLDLSTGSVFEITPTSDIQIRLSNPAASGTVSAATLLLDGANTNTFDLSIATQETSISVSSQSTLPQGLFFKPDGTKMYVCDGTNRDVFQYSLSTAWDVSTASYDSVFADFGSQDTDLRGIFFKDDGTKFYLCGDAGDDVNEYSLSTAWDISTRSFTTNFSVSGQDTEPQGIYFKPDGTKFYIAGSNTSDIYQYALTTAWDISTASYESKSLNVSSQDGVVQDIWLNSDGTKAFVLGGANDALYQYTLSTAYDISTASYDSVTVALSGVDTSVEGLFFKSDGSKFYFVGGSTDKVYQYSCASSATITYDDSIKWAGGTYGYFVTPAVAPTSPAVGKTDVMTFSTRDGGTSYQATVAIDGAA